MTASMEESRLVRLALAKGRISAQDLRAAKEQAGTASVLEWLVARGLLTEPGVAALRAELRPQEPAPVAAVPTPIAVVPREETPRPPEPPAPVAGIAPPASSEPPPVAGLPSLPDVPPAPEATPVAAQVVVADAPAPVAELDAALILKPILEEPPPGVTAAVPTGAERVALRARVDLFLAAAEKKQASDLHLHVGHPVMMRVHGRLLTANAPPLTPADTEAALLAIVPPELEELFRKQQDVDFAYVTASGLRTRANVFRQQYGLDATFRLVPRRIPTLAELGLPEEIARFTHFHSGLVLLTGPAGCGKSTTLNSLVDLLNDSRDDHILTVEDPVEFVHDSKRCLVNQRQVKRHSESFARALKAALREDPDIIVIGELRDYETISLAITAAETGHLVLGSLHTNGATRTIARLLDVFPAAQQGQIRAMVSESLRGIVSQKLIPTVDGTRAVALEVLGVNLAISNLIRDDKMHQVRSAMQVGRAQGMRLLDDSIRELVAAGRVAPEVARRYMESPASLELVKPAQVQVPANAPVGSTTSPGMTPVATPGPVPKTTPTQPQMAIPGPVPKTTPTQPQLAVPGPVPKNTPTLPPGTVLPIAAPRTASNTAIPKVPAPAPPTPAGGVPALPSQKPPADPARKP